MLDTYYRLHKWAVDTGWQTEVGLNELGLSSVADRLRASGRLGDESSE